MRRTARGRPDRPAPAPPVLLAALPALLTGLLAACAPAPAAVPTTTHPPSLPAAELPRLTAEIRQNRASWAERVVEVRVGTDGADDTDDTADGVVVHGVRLTAPSVRGVATSDPGWERRVPAGGAREAPVALGDPVCPPSDGTPTVEVDVRDAAGRAGTVHVVPTDPRGHLQRIAGEDCAALGVAAGLRLAFLPGLEVTGSGRETRATLRLELDPVPGGPDVRVHQVDGTVLVGPPDGGSWQLPDAPVTQRTVVDLDVRPTRCDAHAVAEDKRGSHLGVHASVDGVPVPTFYLATGEELRGELHDLVGRYCDW